MSFQSEVANVSDFICQVQDAYNIKSLLSERKVHVMLHKATSAEAIDYERRMFDHMASWVEKN